ncbi:MAG: hypothetical protein LBI29_01970, partial [Rickettsiales bacterium]|nr:hypothetical protein [Rickettsiales bacterium]
MPKTFEEYMMRVLNIFLPFAKKHYIDDLSRGIKFDACKFDACDIPRKTVTASCLEQIEIRITNLIKIIIGSRTIKPKENLKSILGSNDIVLESDLHGDLMAFLHTLLSNDMVKFRENNPTGIVFWDPVDNEDYSVENLEEKMKNSGESELCSLLSRIQPLPDIIPTEIFGRYINCGDFVDRGEQTEQILFLIGRLHRTYKKQFPNFPTPKMIVGNHENFYIEGSKISIQNAIFCDANHLFSTSENTSVYATSKCSQHKIILMIRATRAAVKSGELCLAYIIGRTIFTHAVITKGMVSNLSIYFNAM